MDSQKYYTIYQITNKINGKIYIGYHETCDLNDGYLGSGMVIHSAIHKYGRENFEKKILRTLPNREAMYEAEAEIVTSEFIQREDVYNLIPGGKKSYLILKENYQKGIEASRSPESKAKRDATMRRLGKGPKYDPTFTPKGIEASRQPEVRARMAQTMRERGHYETENRPMFGMTWITNGREEAVIQKGDSIPDGWDYGRSEESSGECMKWYLSLTQDVRREMAKHARAEQQKYWDEHPEEFQKVLEKREITRKANQEKNGYKQKDSLTKEERSVIAKKNRAIQQAKFNNDPEYKARVLAKREETRKANQIKNGYKQKPKDKV
jgi:hypothetical protein